MSDWIEELSTRGMVDPVLDPSERWKGERIWFGNVVAWGRLAGGAAQIVFGVTHMRLNGGHYFTASLGRFGWYITWFDAS